jgi:cytochrome c553
MTRNLYVAAAAWTTLAVATVPVFAKGQGAFAGNVYAGQMKSSQCVRCHGVGGNSTNSQYPKLAGLSASKIVEELNAFKTGESYNSEMTPMAQQLTTQDMADIAAYFSTQGFNNANAQGNNNFSGYPNMGNMSGYNTSMYGNPNMGNMNNNMGMYGHPNMGNMPSNNTGGMYGNPNMGNMPNNMYDNNADMYRNHKGNNFGSFTCTFHPGTYTYGNPNKGYTFVRWNPYQSHKPNNQGMYGNQNWGNMPNNQGINPNQGWGNQSYNQGINPNQGNQSYNQGINPNQNWGNQPKNDDKKKHSKKKRECKLEMEVELESSY